MKSFPNSIAVIHLPPLVGSPGLKSKSPLDSLNQAGMRAIKEAKMFEKAGFKAIIIENFGDAPFYKEQVKPETVASMALIVAAVKESVRLPVGVNVLRNDARSALGIAAATGADFIRVNILSGVYATDQGIIEGRAAELIRVRDELGLSTAIFADVHVKHAKSLSSDSLELAMEETYLRAKADALVITGETTGRLMDVSEIKNASLCAKKMKAPLYLGSGVTSENYPDLKKWVSGVIVGSDLRKSGFAGADLDASRLNRFFKSKRTLKKSKKK